MRLIIVFAVFVFINTDIRAQVSLDYYLPPGVNYNASIPAPQEILGTNVGEWHVRHDQLVQYMYALAETSDRVTVTDYARSYEKRPLVYLTITSPRNHRNIEQIRQQHLLLSDAASSDALNISEMPAVVQMGYSVHGNESSGANAALVVAYHLAAATGSDISNLLNNTVILLDPSLNPDGLSRFAQWANMHKGKTAVADPLNREHREGFPSGRTNHYWFDLNRDWLPVQHPESRGRINYFHQWLPNVVTDHHEMGTNSTFFFQPGIPTRTHPLTPQRNQELTAEIARFHEEAFNQRQQLYYTRESFDDFYYGKGSTYPDINGSVGILFEQASSRGHAQESVHGILRFPETIKNQITVSLSTLEAVQNMRDSLLHYQRQFFKNAAEEAKNAETGAFIFGTESDVARTYKMAELLRHHNIKVYELAENTDAAGYQFKRGKAFVVPTNQKSYRLINALFERRTSFSDSLFYDVSAFTIPLSFNMPYARIDKKSFKQNIIGPKIDEVSIPVASVAGGRSEYAYLIQWDSYFAPRALAKLHQTGLRVKVASRPFTAMTAKGAQYFDYGTIMVPLDNQSVSEEEIFEVMRRIALNDGITVYSVASGLTPQGVDLGSRSFVALEPPNVAIVVGEGVNAYEAGEVWHLLDQRYEMTPTLLEKELLNRREIDRYNVIVMTDGHYDDLGREAVKRLTAWTENGGTLITIKSAVQWAKRHGLANIELINDEEEQQQGEESRPYAKLSEDSGAQLISGTIFENRLDLTHPLGYGFNRDLIPVFRNSRIFIKPGVNPYSTPLRYTENPLLSGYVSDQNLDKLRNSAGIVVSGLGSGQIISMVDNPNFRAYWYGTNKLFANAVFFGHTISNSSMN